MSSCVILKEDQTSCQPWETGQLRDRRQIREKRRLQRRFSFRPSNRSAPFRSRPGRKATTPAMPKDIAEGRKERCPRNSPAAQSGRCLLRELNQADEAISQQVLDLSIDLARALFKSTLAVRPERIIPIVREAVRYLPAFSQPAMLYLNPGDVVLVQEGMGDELTKIGWQLTSDTQLEPGSCRVETANNQIDASLPTRWQRLTAALGKESDWLVA